MSLAYSLGNWSSVNDYAPEMYRFTKIAIRGHAGRRRVPGRTWRSSTFTDPETLITYRAPVIRAFSEGRLLQEFPAYYGDRWHQAQNPPMVRNWGVGANILQEANRFVSGVYSPAQAGCEDGTSVGPKSEGNLFETTEEACQAFRVARSGLNDRTGFIDQVRKFNRQAEVPNPQ